MPTSPSPIRLSKFLSLILRHDPARVGITLDDHGWTAVEPLLDACARHGHALTRAQLEDVVASSDKQRFALSDDGLRIRANQGHSVDVDLRLPPATPPPTLFHGTVAEALAGIRAEGLQRRARHHVHLSADRGTATKVGGRRGAPVILVVRAGDMVAAGHAFYRSENGVWLTDEVPAAFIDFPAPPAPPAPSRGGRSDIARTTVAACAAGAYRNAGGETVAIGGAIARATAGTVLHELGDSLRPAAATSPATRVTVTAETTLAALCRLAAAPGGHLGCLNYASAKNPGGGFLGGAQAQEESLARASALYPCLLTRPEHYARNRAHASAHYLDLAIFSPGVPFFRDDDGGWLDAPVLASVITCAAPNAGALRQHRRFDAAEVEATLRRRGAFVLAIAAHHGVTRLVLGAWGAGVFGNDPAMVATVFRELLAGPHAGAFVEVVFAIPGAGKPNHAAFAAAFA